MSSFVVSARKYRPATFNTVVGQDSITTTLKNAIKNNHLAQAFLFCGPRGVGKTTCARILAKTINCTNLLAIAEACNECESCLSFNSGQSLNIYELDAASNNSVDDIRALVEQVRYAPPNGRYKIYIIDEVHMLSPGAFNAFLKTLEEPPSYAIFILATTEKHKIIPTILSRCQIFDFSRIQVDDIAKHLLSIARKENIQAEEDALHIIAQKADGALRDALSIFDQIVSFAGNTITYKDVISNLNILDYDYYFKITDEVLEGNFKNALLLFNELLNEGFDGHNFINGFSSHFRDLLVCKDAVTLPLLEVSPGIREKYAAQSKKCEVVLLLNLIEICNRCDIEYRAAKNQRLHVEIALLKMCSANNSALREQKPEIKIVAAKPTEEKKTTDPAPVIPAKETASPSLTTEPKPVYTPKTPSVTSKTPSISSALKKPQQQSEGNTSPEKKTEVVNEIFSEEVLSKVWSAFAEKMNGEGRYSLKATLLKRKPALKENSLIEILIDSIVQDEELKSIKVEMLTFFREKLRNSTVQIETRIIESGEEPETAYTPKEKFKKMLEKNPDLEMLRQQFDLELDF